MGGVGVRCRVSSMIHFLLVFDHAEGRLLQQETFANAADAASAYAVAERAYEGRDDLEIVLVGADSIDTIHQTHGHYFAESRLASKYLAVRR